MPAAGVAASAASAASASPTSPLPPPLLAAVHAVEALIESLKPSTAAALRAHSRSRLARLVLALPRAGSASLSTAASRDLPTASAAYALASASEVVRAVRDGRWAEAVRAADVGMVLLGMPRALPLRRVVEEMEIAVDLVGRAGFDDEAERLGMGEVCGVAVREGLKGRVKEVEAEGLSVERFGEFFAADVPVVVRGCALAWPAVKKWSSAAWLNERCGHRTVPVECTAGGFGEMEERFCTVGDVLRRMMDEGAGTGEVVYLAQHPLFDYVPVLEDDVRQPRFMRAAGKERADVMNIWMGTTGSGSKLHFDSADNFLVQVVGHKEVVLVSPDQSKLVYAKPGAPNVSAVHVEDPDMGKHSKFAEVKGTMVRLSPGDALYIPAMHWHWVKALTSSISVNFWF